MNKHVSLLLDILNFFYAWIEGIVITFIPRRFRTFKSVSGEVVLITGGGSGIGRLLAQRFADRGARVVVWDVNEAGNLETCRLVKESGGEIYAYTVDVSDRTKVYAAAAVLKKEVGVVRVLINNAGIVIGQNLLDLPDDKLVKTFEVNSLAHFWTIKAFLPDMVADNHGHIVTVSSMAGLVGCPQMSDYCAAKFGAVGLDESLKLELFIANKHNVFTTAVFPFFINTGLFEGVKPGPIPLLDANFVADEMVDAVLMNEELLLLPRFLTYIMFLKSVLPRTAQLALYSMLGCREFMADFVGRHGARKPVIGSGEKVTAG